MNEPAPKATAPAELAAEALKEPPKKVDEASRPVAGVLDGRTRELLDEMEANCQARLDELRRKNGELAGDRDRWKLRAEKAEAAADPQTQQRLEVERRAAIRQAGDLQRRVGEMHSELEAKHAANVQLAGERQQLSRELETTRANLAQAFAARDRALGEAAAFELRLAMAAAGSINMTEKLGKLEELDELVAEIREALDPADAKASYWAVWKLLHPNSGVTPATSPKVEP